MQTTIQKITEMVRALVVTVGQYGLERVCDPNSEEHRYGPSIRTATAPAFHWVDIDVLVQDIDHYDTEYRAVIQLLGTIRSYQARKLQQHSIQFLINQLRPMQGVLVNSNPDWFVHTSYEKIAPKIADLSKLLKRETIEISDTELRNCMWAISLLNYWLLGGNILLAKLQMNVT